MGSIYHRSCRCLRCRHDAPATFRKVRDRASTKAERALGKLIARERTDEVPIKRSFSANAR